MFINLYTALVSPSRRIFSLTAGENIDPVTGPMSLTLVDFLQEAESDPLSAFKFKKVGDFIAESDPFVSNGEGGWARVVVQAMNFFEASALVCAHVGWEGERA